MGMFYFGQPYFGQGAGIPTVISIFGAALATAALTERILGTANLIERVAGSQTLDPRLPGGTAVG